MAKAYQSGDTTARYSVSVSVCKGLTPASLAMQCYAFICTQRAKSVKHIFWRNITSKRITSFLLKGAGIAVCKYVSMSRLKFRYAFITDSFTDNHNLDFIDSKTRQYFTQ